MRYKNFLTKAVTFSYDDGTFYDVFLAELLNKYGLKCTFNINSGLFGVNSCISCDGKKIYHNRLSAEQVRAVCEGHEIASHSLSHPLLINRSAEFLDEQVLTDLKNLDDLTGGNTVGFAYPGGPHDDFTDSYLRDKVLYARTVENTYSFDLPNSFVPLHPTVCSKEPEFLSLCREFAGSEFCEMKWLYIWGHSYEFSLPGVYDGFVAACEILSARTDILFATNREIIEYVKCARMLRAAGGELINDSPLDVYAVCDGQNVTVPSHGRVKL